MRQPGRGRVETQFVIGFDHRRGLNRTTSMLVRSIATNERCPQTSCEPIAVRAECELAVDRSDETIEAAIRDRLTASEKSTADRRNRRRRETPACRRTRSVHRPSHRVGEAVPGLTNL